MMMMMMMIEVLGDSKQTESMWMLAVNTGISDSLVMRIVTSLTLNAQEMTL